MVRARRFAMSIQVRNGSIESVEAPPNRRLLALEAAVAALLATANLAALVEWEGSDARAWLTLVILVLAAILFGGYAVYALSLVLRPRPALRIDATGILVPQLGGVLLPWAAIGGAHLEQPLRFLGPAFSPFGELLQSERLHLWLGDEDRLARLVPGWRALGTRRDRVSGGRELRLRLDHLAVTGWAVLECIDAHLRRTARLARATPRLGSAVGMATSL
jgi:hypothetical protein